MEIHEIRAKAATAQLRFKSMANPPDSRILRKILNRMLRQCMRNDLPILRDAPDVIMNRIRRVVEDFRGDYREREKYINDLGIYLIEHGGLIVTNDPARRFVLDKVQFERVIEAAKNVVKPEQFPDRQARLLDLLHITEQTETTATIATEEQAEESPFEEPSLNPAEQLIGALRTQLNGMIDRYPALGKIIQALESSMKTGAAASVDSRSSALLLVCALDELISSVQDETLNELVGSERVDSAMSEKSAPAFDQSALADWIASGKKMFDEMFKLLPAGSSMDLSNELEQLNDLISPMSDQLREIDDIKADAEGDLEALEVIIAQLRERARIYKDDNLAKVSIAIRRAEVKKKALSSYVDALLALRSPVEEKLDALIKRRNAMSVCLKPFSREEQMDIAVPDPPDFNEDELADWKSIDISAVNPPEDGENTPSATVSRGRADVGNGSSALTQLQVETLVLAVFLLADRKKTATRVANVLLKFGLIGDPKERALIFNACTRLSLETTYLHYSGQVGGHSLYYIKPEQKAVVQSRFSFEGVIPIEILAQLQEELNRSPDDKK